VKSIAVVGDVIWDRYVYVQTSRRAQEANIPVWDQLGEEVRPGGAANVAVNVAMLAHHAGFPETVVVKLFGMSSSVRGAFDDVPPPGVTRGSGLSVVSPIVKNRFVSSKGEYLFRHDNRKRVRSVVNTLHENPDQRWDVVVFSDYDKGTIDADVVRFFSERSNVVVIDTKKKDLSIYSGIVTRSLLNVNEKEYSSQLGFNFIPERLFSEVVVTLGDKGARIGVMNEDKCGVYRIDTETIRSRPRNVVDVTGCGDTHTAACALRLAFDSDVRGAVMYANDCAGVKVEMFGACAPPPQDPLLSRGSMEEDARRL